MQIVENQKKIEGMHRNTLPKLSLQYYKSTGKTNVTEVVVNKIQMKDQRVVGTDS